MCRDSGSWWGCQTRITISVDAVFAIAFLHIANYLVERGEGERERGRRGDANSYLSPGKLFSVLNKINVDV